MNTVNLVGRLTRDPDIRYANSGTSVARINVACDRRFRTENGPTADFIPCIAFGKTAEFIENYFHKGQRIGLVGRIQTGNYINNDGQKVYTTDVVIDHVEFVENKGAGNATEARPAPEAAGAPDDDGFYNIPDGLDEELPFN